ncbi:MAG: glutamyl-tRNA reductase [Bacteroidia bacterium]|nr:MAG: glutamyl-tRNA reductase [Bacteroidia bacterium]
MYNTFVFGVSYQSSDFDFREKFTIASDGVENILARLSSSKAIKEVVILSTCNRVEVYCVASDIDFVINAVCHIQHVCPEKLLPQAYIYEGVACANHLFKVISGLDSMILGESEIVAQVKHALYLSRKQNTIGASLSGLFQMGLAVSKEVRTATEINGVSVSLGSAIVNYIQANVVNHLARNVLFIGAGQMMQVIAPYFTSLGFRHKTVVNRTISKACDVAKIMGGEALEFTKLNTIIDDYDIIIVCLGGGKPILDEVMLKGFVVSQKPLLIIDLSFPSMTKIDLSLNSKITLVSMAQIAKLVDVGKERRRELAESALHIIQNKVHDYEQWLKKRDLSLVIRTFREYAESIRIQELELAQRQLNNNIDPRDVLNSLSLRITNKLLHNPTTNLCAGSKFMQEDLVEALGYLFGLDFYKD